MPESCEILSEGRRQEIVRSEERDSRLAGRGIVTGINVVTYDDDMQAGTPWDRESLARTGATRRVPYSIMFLHWVLQPQRL
jgi:hypothetical protein